MGEILSGDDGNETGDQGISPGPSFLIRLNMKVLQSLSGFHVKGNRYNDQIENILETPDQLTTNRKQLNFPIVRYPGPVPQSL